MVTPTATVTATHPVPSATATAKAAAPSRVDNNLPLIVDVKLVPKTPKTPPKFIVNGKSYTITSYKYRKPGSEEWVTLNLTDLDDAGLKKLADACGKLAGEMLQNGQTPHTITLNFERVHSSPSWYHRTNALLMNLLFKYKPEPLVLKEITTKDTPTSSAVVHKFYISNHEDVAADLENADSAEYTIIQNLPPPRKKHHTQKQNNQAPAQNSGTPPASAPPAKTESKVIQVKDDGNCLFHALSKGLELGGVTPVPNQAELRNNVVEWMRDNIDKDVDLKKHIDNAIEAKTSARRADIAQERKSFESENNQAGIADLAVEESRLGMTHQEYLTYITQDKTFGSDAEIYAVHKRYDVNIHINRKISDRVTDLDEPFKTTAERPTITLLHVNGNHFDLIDPR